MNHDPVDAAIPGSVWGGILLVAGSCIGAGMLAIPILTGLLGFFPSLIIMGAAWLFMLFTGLLLVEANGWFYGQVNLLSMSEQSLGKPGRWACWLAYLFLFYSLLVAYIAASATICSSLFSTLLHLSIPPWSSALFFALLFGYYVWKGTEAVDRFNRSLMAGLIVTYICMVSVGIFRIRPQLLEHTDWSYLLLPLPVLVVSFGFQNMIPSLTAYMRGDLKRVRQAIIGGSVAALFVYVVWSLLFLGNVPLEGEAGIRQTFLKGEEATGALRAALHSSWIGLFAQGFAFFAIVTSYLAQGLSLSHFLADGFKKVPDRRNMSWLVPLALFPPLVFALFYPQVFFRALSFAGGICAMILFGFLPIGMIWIGRYRRHLTSNYHVHGGKTALIAAALFTFLVIGCELYRLVPR
jgi:tyrosine-specific transport protein